MAELAGVIIGAVGLIALESTVEGFFHKVVSWKDYGQDFSHYHLQLEIAVTGYQRWRKSVKLEDADDITDARLPVASPEETAVVKKLLQAIVVAFEDAEERSAQFLPETEQTGSAGNDEETLESLAAKFQALNELRRKGKNTWQKVRWVVHDKKVLETLTERVGKNVEQLIRLFPGRVEETQMKLATMELAELAPTDSADEMSTLVQVADIAAKIDPILQQVATDTVEQVNLRHQFRRNKATNGGKANYGDSYGPDAQVPAHAPGYVFEDNIVDGSGSISSYGDRYNMPDIFGK